MCEFCTQHGDGKKWYLEAKNYSDDLLSDIKRQNFIIDFFKETPTELPKALEEMERLETAPWVVQWLIKWQLKRKFKKEHHGQVVPLEDVEQMVDMMSTIVRVPCLCRRETCKEDKAYCIGMTLSPDSLGMNEFVDESFFDGPDGAGLEEISKEEAKKLMADFEKESLCHTIWTFMSPFIGGVCNCDRSDCMAMISSVTHSIPLLYKAEYVAVSDGDKCSGCRACMRLCQFGAIGYSATDKKAFIDPRRCYGCGICHATCKDDAIHLVDRQTHSIASRTWM